MDTGHELIGIDTGSGPDAEAYAFSTFLGDRDIRNKAERQCQNSSH
jgi:hypothetical protein